MYVYNVHSLNPLLQNNDLQLKLTRSRNHSVLELDKGIQERSEKFEKEKLQLIEHNKHLRQQLDKSEAENALIRSNKQEQENELKELRENKQLLNQWERQIHDIIQWVSEEKDARCVPCIDVIMYMGLILSDCRVFFFSKKFIRKYRIYS